MTEQFPKSEMYGLTSQLRRAAVSVPGNIAEGFARFSNAEKIRFYNIAQSSLEESKYYLLLACELGYGNNSELDKISEEAGMLLNGLIRSIRKYD